MTEYLKKSDVMRLASGLSDPQIMAEMVQKWLETFSSYEDMYDGTIDAADIARAYLKQAAELKQLRADNEISESTQAALYKSLLIIQRKYEQLRAERAGLIAEIDKEIIKLEPRLYKTDSEIEILYKFKKLKSKLTDSAQRVTNKEEE